MKTPWGRRCWNGRPAWAELLVVFALVALGTPGCRPGTDGDAAVGAGDTASTGGTAASESQAVPAEPWALVDAAPDTTDGIRVLVLHDMEGLSGQDDWRTFDFGMPQYELGQQMLAADVNAVVDGLFAGGATEVHVVDGHGSGNPAPDLRADLLDERAVQVLRDEPFDTYFDLVERGAYDAVAVVGMHAKTGSGGFASHTYTLGIDFILNGRSITETELVALSWGRAGVPVILASGDDRLAADLQTMPWIQFVTVKTATSASTVNLRPMGEARADLRESARQAVQNLADAKVMKINTPIAATLRAVPPASLALMRGFPGIDFEQDRVSFVVNDLADAYDGLTAIVRVATQSYSGVLREVIRARPESGEVFDAYNVALMERWLDFESGRWSPAEPAEPPAGARYHGYR